MSLLNQRYPWQLELLAKEIIERKVESEGIIEGALAILSPKYIECMKLFYKHPENKTLKHNYFLLATLYDVLKYSKRKKISSYSYSEIIK